MSPCRAICVFFACVALCACPGGEDGATDAGAEMICTPGRLACDPEGTQMLMRCDADGMGWTGFLECDLCHDAQCFGRLDAATDE